MKTKLMLLSACAIMTVSCSQETDEFMNNQSVEPAGEPVTFSASFGDGTTRATETAFETGDLIGVWAAQANSAGTATLMSSGNYADNRPYRYSAGSFQATGTAITLTSGSNGLAYYAVYPYSTQFTNTANITFSVKTDQSTHAAYTASDLCTAQTNPTTDRTVNLTFNHAMSRIMVRLTGNLTNKRVSVKLKNVLTTTTLNLQTWRFNTSGSNAATDIQMLEESPNVFVGLIAPQIISANQNLLEVTVNGNPQLVSFDYEMTMKSGRQTTFTGNYGDDGEIRFGSSINPWLEQGNVPNNVVPYDLQERIRQYMPLYTGTVPPSINITSENGVILFSPSYTVYCSDYQNGTGGEYAPGHITLPSFWGFYNQDESNNTLKIETTEFTTSNGNTQISSYKKAEIAYICGSGNNFTACFNSEGVTTGKNGNEIHYKTADVISGTYTSTGISNMYHAFVMISKTGDTYNDLMDVNEFRVFRDQDGFCDYTEYDLNGSRSVTRSASTPWGNSCYGIRK